jgi:hypothetical protein
MMMYTILGVFFAFFIFIFSWCKCEKKDKEKEIFHGDSSQELENKNNISTISNLSIDNSRLKGHRTLKSMESDKLDVVSENAENLDSEFGDDN